MEGGREAEERLTRETTTEAEGATQAFYTWFKWEPEGRR